MPERKPIFGRNVAQVKGEKKLKPEHTIVCEAGSYNLVFFFVTRQVVNFSPNTK